MRVHFARTPLSVLRQHVIAAANDDNEVLFTVLSMLTASSRINGPRVNTTPLAAAAAIVVELQHERGRSSVSRCAAAEPKRRYGVRVGCTLCGATAMRDCSVTEHACQRHAAGHSIVLTLGHVYKSVVRRCGMQKLHTAGRLQCARKKHANNIVVIVACVSTQGPFLQYLYNARPTDIAFIAACLSPPRSLRRKKKSVVRRQLARRFVRFSFASLQV